VLSLAASGQGKHRLTLRALGAYALIPAAAMVLSALPAQAQDVAAGPCDDLARQVDGTTRQLEEEQQSALPLLAQAANTAPIVLGELTDAALQGAPGLTPDLAGSLAALAPFAPYSANLIILTADLTQLDQMVAHVVAVGALQDSLGAQLQDCQAHNARAASNRE